MITFWSDEGHYETIDNHLHDNHCESDDNHHEVCWWWWWWWWQWFDNDDKDSDGDDTDNDDNDGDGGVCGLDYKRVGLSLLAESFEGKTRRREIAYADADAKDDDDD